MSTDLSEGWDDAAERFMAVRSAIGAGLVRSWAREHLPPGSTIVDVGCGSGMPIAEGLIDDSFAVSGIDASPTLTAAFHARFPDAPVATEAAQDSRFFDRYFDAVISIGLLFLLSEDQQRAVIARVAQALNPGGRFLFSAPLQVCEWPDSLTGRRSVSLGRNTYARLLDINGLRLMGCLCDEGENNYYDAVKA